MTTCPTKWKHLRQQAKSVSFGLHYTNNYHQQSAAAALVNYCMDDAKLTHELIKRLGPPTLEDRLRATDAWQQWVYPKCQFISLFASFQQDATRKLIIELIKKGWPCHDVVVYKASGLAGGKDVYSVFVREKPGDSIHNCTSIADGHTHDEALVAALEEV